MCNQDPQRYYLCQVSYPAADSKQVYHGYLCCNGRLSTFPEKGKLFHSPQFAISHGASWFVKEISKLGNVWNLSDCRIQAIPVSAVLTLESTGD